MAYEDFLASQRWLNLPPPTVGLLSPQENRYQQIMAQMLQSETTPAGLLISTGGYNPAIYDVTPEQSQAANTLNNLLDRTFGGGGAGASTAAAQQAALAAAMEGLTPGEKAAIDAMAIPNLVNFLMPLPIQVLMNVLGIDAPGTTSSGGVSATSGSPMGGIASKGNVGQVANATTTAGIAAANAANAGIGGIGTSPGTVGGGLAGMGSGAAGVAATSAATGGIGGLGGLGGIGGIGGTSGTGTSGLGGMGTGAKGAAASAAATGGIGGGGGIGGLGGGGVGSGGVGNGSGASSAGGSSAGSAYSDMRMKNHITPIDNAINKVRKLDGVTFNMDGKRGTGLVAQQVEKVLPEVVHKDANGMRMVDYGNIVGLLVEAIKEMDGKKQEDQSSFQSIRGKR